MSGVEYEGVVYCDGEIVAGATCESLEETRKEVAHYVWLYNNSGRITSEIFRVIREKVEDEE